MIKMKRTGYSLIEILVVIGIMGILTAVGIASYNQMNSRSQVEQAAQLLATELRTIQKMADSGDNDCVADESFGGYDVKKESNTIISYASVCDNSSSAEDGRYGLVNKVEFVSFIDFRFLGLGKGVSPGQTISLKKGNIFYNVAITAAGGISVEKQE